MLLVKVVGTLGERQCAKPLSQSSTGAGSPRSCTRRSPGATRRNAAKQVALHTPRPVPTDTPHAITFTFHCILLCRRSPP